MDRAVTVATFTLIVWSCASVAAAQPTLLPEWMGREIDVWNGQREGQIADREALYRAAPRGAGTLEDDVLLCRVHVTDPEGGRWDTFGDPDLKVVLVAGRRQAVAWGTENSRTETLSFPGITLRAGEQLTLRVIDRDMTIDEPIGSPSARFDGTFPFTFESTHVEVQCRAPQREPLRARLAASLAAADEAFPAVERATPDLADPGLGRPTPATDAVRRALLAAIAYSGARAEATRERMQRLDAAQRAFDGVLARAVREARREARSTATVAGVEVTVEAWACEGPALARLGPVPEGTQCAVRLRWPEGAAPALAGPSVVGPGGEIYTPTAEVPVEGGVLLAFAGRIPLSQGILRVGRPATVLRP